jgi:hypothetical protein
MSGHDEQEARSRAWLRERRARAFAEYPHAAIFADAWAKREDGEVEIEPHAGCRKADGYCCATCAAEILGVTRPRLAAMRRRGEIDSIGLTDTERKRAREAAGWSEDDKGWDVGVFYVRAEVERLREATS